MKLGVATEIAAGSPRMCRVCLGAFTKLMALHHRPQHLLPQPLHLRPHRNLRHLHRPLLLNAELQSPTEGTADSLGSMKMGVATGVAAGSPRGCRVCHGALTKLMAVHHRHHLLLPTNAMCLRIRGRIADISALTRMAVRGTVAAGGSRAQVHHGATMVRQVPLSFRMLTRRVAKVLSAGGMSAERSLCMHMRSIRKHVRRCARRL